MTRTRCPHCRGKLSPGERIHETCVEPWAEAQEAKAERLVVKKQRVAEKLDRADTRKRKQADKTRGYWLNKAKLAIQKCRRLEELAKGRGCMSCGRSQQEVMGAETWRPGGFWDGGHFLSKGAYPELALEPMNIWLQCKSCNAGGGKYARKGYTVNASYEANLRAVEGDGLVDWLKKEHGPKHYLIDELIEITATYARLARELDSAERHT